MRRGWLIAVILPLAGCATKPAPSSSSPWEDPQAGRFAPEWTPTTVALLELSENAGYRVGPPTTGATQTPPAQRPAVSSPPAPPSPPQATRSDAAPLRQDGTEYVSLSERVSFAVTADGSLPLYFHWRKDGQPIPGATNTVFTIETAKESDAGTYDCVAKNSAGSATSQTIKLVVRKE